MERFQAFLISKAAQLLLCALSISLTACRCNSLFFYPETYLRLTPDEIGINYKAVKVTTKDHINLHHWLLKPSSAPIGRILFLHGNAQNNSTHIRNIHWLTDFGYEVLMVDYRGYGKSEGAPCVSDVIEDVRASFEWFESYNGDKLPLFILGQSLGASLAAYSVGAHPEWPLQGVILDAPFAGYRDIVRDKLAGFWLTWPFQYPASQLFSDQYSPDRVIAQISPRPLLMFASKRDRVVPFSQSQKLFDAAKTPKRLIETDGGHIATFSKEAHRQQLLVFLKEHDTVFKLD